MSQSQSHRLVPRRDECVARLRLADLFVPVIKEFLILLTIP
jgi:hypothetical protein